ncbi:hypothetical protein HPP92_026606 [Vanilla planifolia]|uniref:Uncharacterized protein n=1 Tax=Vanilla planifolia TaxID=51239 RepID=A0A835PDJ1_VANPL|nr:hypothetical protein HPP92_026606 [Vanilla planifolia]
MTAKGRRVTAFAKSTAVSTMPVRPGKTYPLSVLDHAMEQHVLHMVFYYRSGPTVDRFRLKESLSELLCYFPAITGRLTKEDAGEEAGGWKRWIVRCNDAGVRLLDARADATLEEWIGTATAAEERELAYWEPMGDDPSIWSTFYVQITEFKDKGYAIGLSCTHMHADITCATLFIKAWADSHRRACIANAPFFHPTALLPRSNPNPFSPLLSLKSSSPTSAPRRMASATFRFPSSSVRSLLSHLPADSTPFAALSALFLLAIYRAASLDPGPHALTVVTDFRKRMYAPLPHGFYGNATHFSRVEVDPAAGLASVVGQMDSHVSGLQEEEYWSTIEWLAERWKHGNRGSASTFRMYGPELTFVKVDHVMAYESEMVEGVRPVHVSCWVGGSEGGEGVVMVLPSPEMAEGEEAARTVEVTLPAEVAEKVFTDEEILGYGTTVVFSGRVN